MIFSSRKEQVVRARIFWAYALLLTSVANAEDINTSKLGSDAIPMQQATEYLRLHPAPDYWAISPFYKPQETDSDCSVANVVILINVFRGISYAGGKLVTPKTLLATVKNWTWLSQTREHSEGVTFNEMQDYLQQALKVYGLKDYEIEILRPTEFSPSSLSQVRDLLRKNELSDRDVVLAYFNQGVLTGEWDGPHISPVGAYDEARDRVLIMDVDRQYYVPYWTSITKLLEAMVKPTPSRFGHLSGKSGGLIWVKPRSSEQAPAVVEAPRGPEQESTGSITQPLR